MLPESMPGENFLEKYTDHNDPVTVVDNKRSYGVRAAARHPIYENFRVKVSFFFLAANFVTEGSNWFVNFLDICT